MGRRRLRIRVTGGLLALVAPLALSACGGGDATGEARLGVPADDLLSFSGTTLAGSELDASTLEGTATVFWFWAPWCSICRAEAPAVERVAEAYADRVSFVGVPGLGQVSAMRTFVDDTGTTALTHVIDDDGSLWKRFGVTSQPSFVFVAADGDVTAVHGSMKEPALEKAVAGMVDG